MSHVLDGTRSPENIENLHQELSEGSQEEGDEQGKFEKIEIGLADVE